MPMVELGVEPHSQGWIVTGQDRSRQQGGVHRPGPADGQGSHRHAGRHLHDRQKTVQSFEMLRFNWHAQHWKDCPGSAHAG
jgi:hypothetical protein